MRYLFTCTSCCGGISEAQYFSIWGGGIFKAQFFNTWVFCTSVPYYMGSRAIYKPLNFMTQG